jgi:hypothetical protein
MTKPTFPIAAFFQPVRYLSALAQKGHNIFFGPEVENAKTLPPASLALAEQAWRDAVKAASAWCVLKRPPAVLPDNCFGVCISVDEPNGKSPVVDPAQLKAESDALRAAYPGTQIFLSLAGDKITSANFAKPAELQLYKDYGALADVLTVDTYSKNRSEKYPTTWTGDAVKKLKDATGKPVWAWVECNDQRLSPPPAPFVNRAPTPDEIQATVDYAIAQGATGIGFFYTCDSGKYGWPESYFPQVDRNGASMGPQYAKVREIALALSPPAKPEPTPIPTDPAVIARLGAVEKQQAETAAVIAAIRKALAATQPVNP